jgi:hypothetical protein
VQREFRKQFQSDPPCKANIFRWYRQFQNRLMAALGGLTTTDMLQRVGEEIDYQLHVCCVTRGAQIEGL